MMSDYLYAHLRSFLDISYYGVKSPVAFRAWPQHNVFGIHSYGFKNNPGFITIVFHPPEFIKIPGAVLSHLAQLCGEVLYTVA